MLVEALCLVPFIQSCDILCRFIIHLPKITEAYIICLSASRHYDVYVRERESVRERKRVKERMSERVSYRDFE